MSGRVYLATQGTLELTLWEDHADLRVTDLVFNPAHGPGDALSVPLLEVADVGLRVCNNYE